MSLHTRKMVDEVMALMPSGTFRLIGSVATKGQSNNDIDLLCVAGDDWGGWHRLTFKLQRAGFEWIGNTNYGEIWFRASDSVTLDFWFGQ